MQTKIELPEEMPATSAENYWPVYHQWKAIAFRISKEDYESLDEAPKKQLKTIILKYENVSIPMTPRLAGMALSDKRNAARQINNLGLREEANEAEMMRKMMYKPDGFTLTDFGVA